MLYFNGPVYLCILRVLCRFLECEIFEKCLNIRSLNISVNSGLLKYVDCSFFNANLDFSIRR